MDATQVNSWSQAAVAIVAMLVPLALAIVKWLQTRAERDAIIRGVETGADSYTKSAVRKEAKKSHVDESLHKAVKRITGWAIIAILFTGCMCSDKALKGTIKRQTATIRVTLKRLEAGTLRDSEAFKARLKSAIAEGEEATK